MRSTTSEVKQLIEDAAADPADPPGLPDSSEPSNLSKSSESFDPLFTSAAVMASVAGEPFFEYTAGEQPAGPATLYDLASLTKPLATALLVLRLVERGELSLETRLGDTALGGAGGPDHSAADGGGPAGGDGQAEEQHVGGGVTGHSTRLAEAAKPITIRQLLTHTAGFSAAPNLPPVLERGEDPRAALLATEPEAEPGNRVLYSCTGFLFLGELLRARTGLSLCEQLAALSGGRDERDAGGAGNGDGTVEGGGDAAVASRVGAASCREELLFRPGLQQRRRCVPTEYDPWRARRIHGEVHDENAYCLGGDAGNAGLFGSARAVHEQALGMWGSLVGAPKRQYLLSNAWAAESAREHASSEEERRGLGMQLACPASPVGPAGAGESAGGRNRASGGPPGGGGSIDAGGRFGPRSFGHTGFTGTSFWIEPERQLVVVALTNRLYYGREETAERLRRFRREVHSALLSVL